MLFQVGSDGVSTRRSSRIKRLQGLGMTVKGSRAQLLLSSICPAAGKEWYSPADQYLAPSLVSPIEFRDFDHDLVYSTPDLLAMDGVHLSQRRKRIFAQKLEGLIKTTLN